MKLERNNTIYGKCNVCGETKILKMVYVPKGDGTFRRIYICKECEE